MEHSAAIGAGRNPRFGGVAIVSPNFSVSSLWNPNSRRQTIENKRVQGMWCWNTPPLFSGTPPLCPCSKKHAVFWDTKITLDLALSYRVGKTVRSVRRVAVNRDPFHNLRFGKHQEFLVPIRRTLQPSVVAHKFLVVAVKRLPNRANLLLHRQPLDHLPRRSSSRATPISMKRSMDPGVRWWRRPSTASWSVGSSVMVLPV